MDADNQPRANGGPSAESVLAALTLVREGRVFSLESGWWRGMPVHPVHPAFELLTYRTPRGFRVQRDQDYMIPPINTVGYGFISELIMCTTHAGTHIDAFAHVTCGDGDVWHGGGSAATHLGDFGALDSDASELPPIVARGILLDIPPVIGRDHCPPGFMIGPSELSAAAEREGVEFREGDVVLIRTGQMLFWPDADAIEREAGGSGLSLAGAEWLSQRLPSGVGADTVQLECNPSGVEGSPQPVHIHLMRDNGISILEWVNCEDLAAAGVFEFLFLCLPLTVTGATGSLIRPVAIS
jgi:kynurenine formamidase